MLWDEQRLSSAVRCQNGNMKSFRSIKLTILSTLNAFRENGLSKAPGYGLKINGSKPGNSDSRAELFHENGLYGLLETSNFHAVNNVSFLF